MPEIRLYYLAQPRTIYIQPRTTASETLYTFFDREEFFRDNLKCFSIIAVYGASHEDSSFVILQPHEYPVEHYGKTSIFIISLTHPPHISDYQGYLKESEDFIYALYAHVRLALKLGFLCLGLGIVGQLIAQSILVDYGLENSAPFRQDANKIRQVLYDYLPDNYMHNSLQSRFRLSPRQIAEREGELLLDIFRYLQIQHLTRSGTKIYMINYIVLARKGTTCYDYTHFHGTCAEVTRAGKVCRHVPCHIGVSLHTRDLVITFLRLPRSCATCCAVPKPKPQSRSRSHNVTVDDTIRLQHCIYSVGMYASRTCIRYRTPMDIADLSGGIMESPSLQLFYISPYTFYRIDKTYTLASTNIAYLSVATDNTLAIGIRLTDTTRHIQLATPGAPIIVSLWLGTKVLTPAGSVKRLASPIPSQHNLHTSGSSPGLRLAINSYSGHEPVADESPVVSVITVPSTLLRSPRSPRSPRPIPVEPEPEPVIRVDDTA